MVSDNHNGGTCFKLIVSQPANPFDDDGSFTQTIKYGDNELELMIWYAEQESRS